MSSNPYTIGATLALRLETHDNVDAHIVGLLAQPTLSVVVVVRLDQPPLQGLFALQLHDRIHASQLRDDADHPWTPQVETAYREFVASGEAASFFRECESQEEYWAHDKGEKWTDSQKEAHLQSQRRQTYNTERQAYQLLSELQGTHVPKVFAHPFVPDRYQPRPEIENIFLDHPGMLMEYITGRLLADLADWAPEDNWQSLCEEAIRVVHLIGEKGVCNRDIRPRNLIVRPASDSETHRVILLDFGLCYFRIQAKDDEEFRKLQAFEDEEGAVGCVMEKKLGGKFKYRHSARAQRLLDEFMGE